jgi:hypothetical protein
LKQFGICDRPFSFRAHGSKEQILSGRFDEVSNLLAQEKYQLSGLKISVIFFSFQ